MISTLVVFFQMRKQVRKLYVGDIVIEDNIESISDHDY